MKRASLTIVAFLAVGGVAQSDVFEKPPEIYAGAWSTPFPYQRNINLGFGVYPVAAPGSGFPGAVYEGWLDPELKVSDFVSFVGDVQWYNNLAGITPTGLIGIDNRAGAETLTGWAILHVDNTLFAEGTKHVWLETDFGLFNVTPGTQLSVSVQGPAGYSSQFIPPYYIHGMPNGFTRLDNEWEVMPNPSWELVILQFDVNPGGYALVDGIHIATECIPEPSIVSCLLLGLAILFATRSSSGRGSVKGEE
jgi:hypothetical protein